MKTISLNASSKTKHTPAGEIPVDWGWAKLGTTVKPIISGTSVSGEERPADPNEAKVLKVSAVTSGKFLPEKYKTVSDQDRLRLKAPVKGQTILVNRANGSANLVGTAVYVAASEPRLFLPDKLWQVEPINEKVAPRFISGLLRSPSFRRKVLARSSGGTGMMNIGSRAYLGIPIPLPPLPEQRKIAETLSTWDAALEKLDALILAKEQRKKALMQQLLTGKKRLKGFKGNWKRIRMHDLLKREFRPSSTSEDSTLRLVSIRRRMGGLFNRPSILASEYKTQDLHSIRTGDFLISKRQVSHGAWSIVEDQFDGTLVSKEYAIIVNIAPEKLNMRFFAWLAQTKRMQMMARVSSNGVHIEKLIFDPTVFLRNKIRVPQCISLQRKIADILDSANIELKLLRDQKSALTRQKRGLMQKLLTGKWRVTR